MHAARSDDEGTSPILGARAHRDRKQGSEQLLISLSDRARRRNSRTNRKTPDGGLNRSAWEIVDWLWERRWRSDKTKPPSGRWTALPGSVRTGGVRFD